MAEAGVGCSRQEEKSCGDDASVSDCAVRFDRVESGKTGWF